MRSIPARQERIAFHNLQKFQKLHKLLNRELEKNYVTPGIHPKATRKLTLEWMSRHIYLSSILFSLSDDFPGLSFSAALSDFSLSTTAEILSDVFCTSVSLHFVADESEDSVGLAALFLACPKKRLGYAESREHNID